MLMLKLFARYAPTRLRKTQAGPKFNYAGDEHFIRFCSLMAEFVEQEAERAAHA
jgi:hypothetical protein